MQVSEKSAQVELRNIRVSPQKLNLVAQSIRGIKVDKGLCMRRFQARGRSKNGIIKKFFSHLRIVVTEKTVEEGN